MAKTEMGFAAPVVSARKKFAFQTAIYWDVKHVDHKVTITHNREAFHTKQKEI